MARPTARRRSAGASSRSRSPRRGTSASSQQALVIGGLGVIVLVLVVVFATGGGSARAAGDGRDEDPGPATAGTAKPETPKPEVPAVGKAGKTPDRPAPELSADTLARLDDLHRQAVAHYNDSVRARSAGDHAGAREAAGKAKEILEQWKQLIRPQLDWQEEADFGEWEQPGEYMALDRRYQKHAELDKKVRMGGG